MVDCWSCKYYANGTDTCLAPSSVKKHCPVPRKDSGHVTMKPVQQNKLDAKKDPRGLIRNDMAHLRTVFPRKPYSPKNTVEDIMFAEGVQHVLRYIEEEMVAKR